MNGRLKLSANESPVQAQTTAPTVRSANATYLWNLAAENVMVRPDGFALQEFFCNAGYIQDVTVEFPAASIEWCKLHTGTDEMGRRLVYLVSNFIPDTASNQEFTAYLWAQNSDGTAVVNITGILRGPSRPNRYPMIDDEFSLGLQTFRWSDKWFVDKYPPQAFDGTTDYKGYKEVLGVTVGPAGQPAARVARYKDNSLSAAAYNKQGARYKVDQDLDLDDGVLLTANVYIPAAWVTAAPNTSACSYGPGCARVALFEVELGKKNIITSDPTFVLRLGFDNRVPQTADVDHAFLEVAGPALEKSLSPLSPLGTKLVMPTLSATRLPLGSFKGALQLDAWNRFSVLLKRVPRDQMLTDKVNRGCKETLRVQWTLNGYRHAMNDLTPAISICTEDTDGKTVSTTTDIIRDVIVSAYNTPQEDVPEAQRSTYTAHWNSINVYKSGVQGVDWDKLLLWWIWKFPQPPPPPPPGQPNSPPPPSPIVLIPPPPIPIVLSPPPPSPVVEKSPPPPSPAVLYQPPPSPVILNSPPPSPLFSPPPPSSIAAESPPPPKALLSPPPPGQINKSPPPPRTIALKPPPPNPFVIYQTPPGPIAFKSPPPPSPIVVKQPPPSPVFFSPPPPSHIVVQTPPPPIVVKKPPPPAVPGPPPPGRLNKSPPPPFVPESPPPPCPCACPATPPTPVHGPPRPAPFGPPRPMPYGPPRPKPYGPPPKHLTPPISPPRPKPSPHVHTSSPPPPPARVKAPPPARRISPPMHKQSPPPPPSPKPHAPTCTFTANHGARYRSRHPATQRISRTRGVASLAACQGLCSASAKCVTYAYKMVDTRTCNLFSVPKSSLTVQTWCEEAEDWVSGTKKDCTMNQRSPPPPPNHKKIPPPPVHHAASPPPPPEAKRLPAPPVRNKRPPPPVQKRPSPPPPPVLWKSPPPSWPSHKRSPSPPPVHPKPRPSPPPPPRKKMPPPVNHKRSPPPPPMKRKSPPPAHPKRSPGPPPPGHPKPRPSPPPPSHTRMPPPVHRKTSPPPPLKHKSMPTPPPSNGDHDHYSDETLSYRRIKVELVGNDTAIKAI